MEQLRGDFTLWIPESAFPLSTDSIALADFVKLAKAAKVLDLGSGCGTLGLLLCANWNDCTVTGVEIDPKAHTMALHNACALELLTADLPSTCMAPAPDVEEHLLHIATTKGSGELRHLHLLLGEG